MSFLQRLEDKKLVEAENNDVVDLYDIGEEDAEDIQEEKRRGLRSAHVSAKDKEEAARKRAIDILTKKTPEEVFAEFDTDGSGELDPEEFIEMLPRLGVMMSTAKAMKYFRMCDMDDSGAIDLEEFKVAMFAVDPDSGNTMGFSPNKLLTPRDAFDMFDDDRSGKIDEDEFADVIEYLGIKISDAKQEKYFQKYDMDNSGFIEYIEFKRIWLSIVDPRIELAKRGIQVSKFASRPVLKHRLQQVIDEEEEREAKVMAEAELWRDWQMQLKIKTSKAEAAKKRALDELCNALDTGGQVYLFGRGTYNQFDGDPVRPSEVFREFELVQKLWESRVESNGKVRKRTRKRGTGSEKGMAAGDRYSVGIEEEDEEDAPASRMSRTSGSSRRSDRRSRAGDSSRRSDRTSRPADSRASARSGTSTLSGASGVRSGGTESEEREPHPFDNIVCAVNTAALWGRRVVQASLSNNNAFAITAEGQILVWGGRDNWWVEYQSKKGKNGAQSETEVPMTERSQLTMGMKTRPAWKDEREQELDLSGSVDDHLGKLKFVTKEYYKIWEPPPSNATRALHMKNVILPRLTRKDVALSLTIRGVDDQGKNKEQLLEVVYELLEIEHRELGKEMMNTVRETEIEIMELEKRKKMRQANILKQSIIETWKPLLSVWAEVKAAREQAMKGAKDKRERNLEKSYRRWRKQEDAAFTSSQLVPYDGMQVAKIETGTVTARGGAPTQARQEGAVKAISAGAFHAAVIHNTGTLYTWGDSNFGRLGLRGEKPGQHMERMPSVNESGELRHPSRQSTMSKSSNKYKKRVQTSTLVTGGDRSEPTLVSAANHFRTALVSCGYSHSALVTEHGQVLVWGGAMNGKLGLGHMTEEFECYCPVPTPVPFPGGERIVHLSCGNSHTGAVSSSGNLYMWGCGDSGRLGLGPNLRTCYEPALVSSLQVAGVKVAQVSCGVSHTVIATGIERVEEGESKNKVTRLTGGHVYVAGPAAVLGKYTPHFKLVRELHQHPVRQISAGNGTTACVSHDGELYTWGKNDGGGIGHNVYLDFVPVPSLVECLYVAPTNLALEGKARQSSVYNNQGPEIAVDGDFGGMGEKKCTHTQVDEQAFWEVDLGQLCVIESISLWNREDAPPDTALSRDLFTRRLFPCWMMVSPTPFKRGLVESFKTATAKRRFTKLRRRTSWHFGNPVVGRYVRVQLEGTNYLHIAEVQVFGTRGMHKTVGRVDSVSCGNEAMVVVVEPKMKQKQVEEMYLRAVKADARNSMVLRQYFHFFSCWDRWGMGEKIGACPVDQGSIECEVCTFMRECVAKILPLPPGPNGRIRRLNSICQMVLDQDPPPLKWQPKEKENNGIVANVIDVVDNFRNFFTTFGTRAAAKKLVARRMLRRGTDSAARKMTIRSRQGTVARIKGRFRRPTTQVPEENPAPQDRRGSGTQEGQKEKTNAMLAQGEVELQNNPDDDNEESRDTENKSAKDEASDNRSTNKGTHPKKGLGCIACDACEHAGGFLPTLFDDGLCSTCTHPAEAHIPNASF